jgi:outer membrane protein OmpA-like peptidoglycan-associated protein
MRTLLPVPNLKLRTLLLQKSSLNATLFADRGGFISMLSVSDTVLLAFNAKSWLTEEAVAKSKVIQDLDYFKVKRAVRHLKNQGLLVVGKPLNTRGRKAVRLTVQGVNRRIRIEELIQRQPLETIRQKVVAPVVFSSAILSACTTARLNDTERFENTPSLRDCRLGPINTPVASSMDQRIASIAEQKECGPFFKVNGTPPKKLEVPEASEAKSSNSELPPAVPNKRSSQTPYPSVSKPADVVLDRSLVGSRRESNKASNLAAINRNGFLRAVAFFNVNTFNLSAGSKAQLAKAVDATSYQYVIVAGTDPTGSVERNRILARARGLVAAKILIQAGVPKDKIKVILKPRSVIYDPESLRAIEPNHPSDLYSIARRVEIYATPNS